MQFHCKETILQEAEGGMNGPGRREGRGGGASGRGPASGSRRPPSSAGILSLLPPVLQPHISPSHL